MAAARRHVGAILRSEKRWELAHLQSHGTDNITVKPTRDQQPVGAFIDPEDPLARRPLAAVGNANHRGIESALDLDAWEANMEALGTGSWLNHGSGRDARAVAWWRRSKRRIHGAAGVPTSAIYGLAWRLLLRAAAGVSRPTEERGERIAMARSVRRYDGWTARSSSGALPYRGDPREGKTESQSEGSPDDGRPDWK